MNIIVIIVMIIKFILLLSLSLSLLLELPRLLLFIRFNISVINNGNGAARKFIKYLPVIMGMIIMI